MEYRQKKIENNKFFNQFKRIRNQIRKLDPNSLINLASKKLHEIENKSINDWEGFLPWRLLLIIKWGFEFGGENYPLQIVDEHMLVKLMNMLHELEGVETNPFLEDQSVKGLQKFLRTIAFQQFWLQSKLGGWVISRQKVLFSNLPTEHTIQITFKQSMGGLRMIDFLELSFLLWVWVTQSSENLLFQPETLYKNLDYPKDLVASFCGTISLSTTEVRSYLRNRKQVIENPYFQLLEKSPFIRYPTLKLDNRYLVYSQKLLEETIANIFYDVMKTEGGSDLTEQFGKIFENYIDRGLSTLNIEYHVEKKLSSAFPDTNVTDFLVPFSDLTLMIEVKAVELRPIVKVFPADKPLQHELEDSIIKGTIQGFSLANSISLGSDSLYIPSRTNFFLMIVTYRDLFLGAGDVAWDEFLKEEVEPVLESKGIRTDLIPPEHIIILSVDEFDQFISILWQGLATIPDIFNHMLESNQAWETRKWMFSQHLDKYRSQNPQHPFLDDEFESISNTIKDKFI